MEQLDEESRKTLSPKSTNEKAITKRRSLTNFFTMRSKSKLREENTDFPENDVSSPTGGRPMSPRATFAPTSPPYATQRPATLTGAVQLQQNPAFPGSPISFNNNANRDEFDPRGGQAEQQSQWSQPQQSQWPQQSQQATPTFVPAQWAQQSQQSQSTNPFDSHWEQPQQNSSYEIDYSEHVKADKKSKLKDKETFSNPVFFPNDQNPAIVAHPPLDDQMVQDSNKRSRSSSLTSIFSKGVTTNKSSNTKETNKNLEKKREKEENQGIFDEEDMFNPRNGSMISRDAGQAATTLPPITVTDADFAAADLNIKKKPKKERVKKDNSRLAKETPERLQKKLSKLRLAKAEVEKQLGDINVEINYIETLLHPPTGQ